MNSHEAYGVMIPRGPAGHAKVHALALDCSVNLVEKYRRPHEDVLLDSGARNDIDRLEITMRTALGQMLTERDALAGLHCLAGKFNHVCVRIPLPGATVADQTQDVLKAMEEIGQWSSATSKALEDGVLSERESMRILEEGYEAMAAIMASLQHCKPKEGE